MTSLDHRSLAARLYPAVAAAGRLTLEHRARGITIERKSDGSPVTAADQEAEVVLLAAIAEALPQASVLSEEAESAHSRGAPVDGRGLVVMVDPLDGTREYVAGGDDFTVNIGITEDGVPVFGMILQPTSGRLWATIGLDRVIEAAAEVPAASVPLAALKQREVATREPDPNAVVALCSRSHLADETTRFLTQWPVREVRRLGSSLKFGILASGEADIYPRHGPTHVWDTCAGHAILAAAGGMVTTIAGEELTYSGLVSPYVNPGFVAWGRPSLRGHARRG